MKHFSLIMVASAAAALLAACSASSQMPASNNKPAAATTATNNTTTATARTNTLQYSFPKVNQNGKVAIVAHRGFWNCDEGGRSENSIAALKAAQNAGLWGSECDVHITADDVVIVNHDGEIKGKKIATHKFADFSADLLPNGERRPTIDQYLDQAAKCSTTKLIVELKPQAAEAREDALVDKTIAAIKAHGLYDPSRVLFISFSRHICEKIAAEHPRFVNQFLSSNFAKNENPESYARRGINGIDYHHAMFKINPGYVTKAHELGMSVNAWTVDETADIKAMISASVDAITSNQPLRVRELLGDKEYRNK